MPKKLRPVTPGDLYKLKQLYHCSLSPCGKFIVTAVDAIDKAENKTYKHLYVQPTSGGKLRQFTRGESVDHSPQFSPDGKLIAFLSTRSKKSQLHLIHTDGGESWQLTTMPGGVGSFNWSPDSKSIVFTFIPQDEEAQQRERKQDLGKEGFGSPKARHVTRFFYKLDGAGFLAEGSSEIHTVKVKSAKTTQLVKDKFDNVGPVFTPDGQFVVFHSNKHPNHELEVMFSDLYKVRADGTGRVAKIATFGGPASEPAISPDGRWIAFRGHENPELMWNERNTELFVVPVGGGQPQNLSHKLDRPVENLSLGDTGGMPGSTPLAWSPDSTQVYSQVTIDGNTEIYCFDVKNGGFAPLFSEPGVVLAFAIDFSQGRLYCSFSNYERPGDLLSRKLAGGALKQLTNINKAWLGKRDLGLVHELWVKGQGGHRIHGWVMLPPNYSPKRKYPALLYIHGGPHVAYARSIFHEFNYLAGLGYIVLFCNPRGSQGYGEKYVSAIADAWGDSDYSDLMKFTDAALRRFPAIDKDRLGVTGGSYGGYMTNWIIGHTKRFKAAVTQRCVSNFFSFMGSSDIGFLFHYEFRSKGKSPWQDPERFLELSPMTHLVNATTPTLVIHGEDDLRTPIEQGEQVYVQLKLQGVETEMVRFPEESHGLSRGGRTDRRIDRLEHISNWMGKYLKKRK